MSSEALIDGLVAATAVIVAAWVGSAVLRRAPAALRNSLWRAALAGVWLAPMVVIGAQALHLHSYEVAVPVLPATSEVEPAPGAGEDSGPIASSAVGAPPWTPLVSSSVSAQAPEPVPPSAAPMSLEPAPPQEGALAGVEWGFGELLLGLWLVGGALGVVAFLRDIRAVRRLVRDSGPVTDPAVGERIAQWSAQMGLRKSPDAFGSGAVTVPSVVGWRRPRLLLPSGLSEMEGNDDSAIVHELAHVLRGDVAVQAAARLTRALWWWHPLVWLAARELRSTAEEACDDWVIALTGERKEYAEVLVHWAEASQAVGSLGCASRGRALVTRVRRILEGKQMPKVRLSWQAKGALAVCVVGAIIVVGGVRVRAVSGDAGAIGGTVLGLDEKPLARAQVWLIDLVRDARRNPTTAAVTKTSADGCFSLQATDLRRGYRGEWEIAIAAFAPGHALTWTSAAGSVSDLTLALGPAEAKPGKVTDATGKPLSGVRIVPRFLRRDQLGFETWFGSGLFLPREVGEALSVTTSADGSYRLPWMPRYGEVSFRLTKAGYGTITYWPGEEEPGVFRLVEGAKIQGKVVDADPAAFGGKTVLARSRYRGTSNEAEGVVDEEGRFVLEDLYPGDWTVWLEYDPTQPWQAAKQGVKIAEPGAEEQLEIKLQRGILLTGVVQDAETGRPLADVEVFVTGPRTGGLPVTGPDGRYEGHLLPGELSLYATRIPRGYRGPEGGALSFTVPQAERFEAPAMDLRRAAPVQVLVVDSAGKPVPGAAIFRNPVVEKTEAQHGPFFTDQLGRYAFLRIKPGTVMELIAIKDDLVTGAPVRVAAGRSRMPVRLELEAGLAPTIRGRVVDEQEQPVAEAAVTVRAKFDHWPGPWLRVRTGADGSFTITQLDPNRDYQVEIKAPSFPAIETEWLHAEPRGSYDLGDIVLTRAHGVVRGRVVDSGGEPVGGVRVFNSGDGPEPTSVTTEADGSFALTGLFEGPAYIFAQHPGFVFTGVPADTGGEPVTIVLRRRDEPPGDPQPKPAPMRVLSEAEERALARDLILRAMEDADTERSKRRLVHLLAKADLEEARRFAEEDETLAEEIDRALGEELLVTDPEQAIGYLQSHSDARVAANSLISAAEELAGTHPNLAREAAWPALPAARQIGEPSNAMWLAHIGRLLCDLGQEEEGKQLLREAYSMVKDLGHEDMGASLRSHVARYLAPTDLAAALELVEPIEEDHRKGLGDIAAAIAPTDPEGAVSVLDGLEEWIRNRGLTRVCHIVAEKDPDRALKIAETIRAPEERILALGYIAVQLAEKDKGRAIALLDEALELIPDRGPFHYASSAAAFSRLAHFAQDVGHPDLRRFVMRLMSLRDTRRTGVLADYAWRLDLTLMTVLMAVDMQAAQHILDRVSPDAQLMEGRAEFGGLGLIVCSVAMFDPGQAIEMIEQRGEELHELRRAVAEFLLTPPAQRGDWPMAQSASNRAYFLPGQAGHYWAPLRRGGM